MALTVTDISKLIASMKEAGFATKQDVEDIMHDKLTEFYAGMIKPDIDELKQGQKRLEVGQSHIKDDIKGLGEELAIATFGHVKKN